MANTLNAKQMRQLLQSISTDPQLKQSKDTILLAEDQYPESLDAVFTRLTTPTTLQNTINLLKWNRKSGGTNYDAELRAITIKSQDYIRTTYQFTPTADSPWGYVYLPTVEVLCYEFMFVRGSRSSEIRGQCERHATPLRPRSI